MDGTKSYYANKLHFCLVTERNFITQNMIEEKKNENQLKGMNERMDEYMDGMLNECNILNIITLSNIQWVRET